MQVLWPSLQTLTVFFLLFIKAGHPRATRLCKLTDDGAIELQTPKIGDCNLNLGILEEQVCPVAHLMGSWKKPGPSQCFLNLLN